MDTFDATKVLGKESRDALGTRLLNMADFHGIQDKIINLGMDHFCIRTSVNAHTDSLLQTIEANGGYTISEAIVNGRTIHICRLPSEVQVATWTTKDVEIPYTNGKNYPQALEHAELFLGIKDPNLRMDDLRHKLASILDISVEQLLKLHGYEESTPSANDEELPNPTIEIRSGDRLTALKFHNLPIGVIVGYDKLEEL